MSDQMMIRRKSKIIGTWDVLQSVSGRIMQHEHIIVAIYNRKILTACGLKGTHMLVKIVYSTYPKCKHCQKIDRVTP